MILGSSRALTLLFLTSLLLLSVFGNSQTLLQGKVNDTDGQPLKNVVITTPQLGERSLSDAQGHFSLHVKANSGAIQLTFDAPGYYSLTATYDPTKEPMVMDVVLTPLTVVREEVNVVESRLDIPLEVNPAATAIVTPARLEAMPRGVGAEEALASVPGVKVDNQANGERVHLSIRGQGILSEHGIRGIQVLYDGIPLNDPSGFAPDLFDVDWNGVSDLQVVRGPVGVLYGGGSAGGVIDIRTAEPENVTHGGLWSTGGSNGFYKARANLSGIASGVGYSFALSRAAGDGYRDHSAFWGDNFFGRLGFSPNSRLRLNVLLLGTGYFNQNPEGLAMDWMQQNRRQANPDSITYNEYQKTIRFTGAVSGNWTVGEGQHLAFNFFTRRTQYDEPVPSSVDHRTYWYPGGSAQYHIESGNGSVRNYFSVGSDLDRQGISERIYPNLGLAVQGSDLLALQSITQNRAALYAMDRVALGNKWTLFGSGRWDHISNRLDDNLKAGGTDLSGSQNFQRGTARVGVSWTPVKEATLYGSWGQGFLPPATEELESNPAHIGGFNMGLKPATSQGEEIGIRGGLGTHFYYDSAFFHLNTHNDFERYRIADRPLETFYDNAGDTSRYGVEASMRWMALHRLTLSGAYTYSHFTYTTYDSLMYPGNQVGHFLPNTPEHQLNVAAELNLPQHIFLDIEGNVFSHAYIDPINNAWIDTYGLMNARIRKGWQRSRYYLEAFVYGRNLTNDRYVAFTEPDYPDRHSYQPGPEREVFGGVKVQF
jgi:iron complex outermembrane receptor protein